MSELKTKWPEPPGKIARKDTMMYRAALYERARAEAAIERLNYLADGLKAVIEHNASIGAENAREWLEAIGPIPGEQT